MKNKILGLVCVAIVFIVSAMCLCACEIMSGNGTVNNNNQSNDKKSDPSVNTIQLNEALDNYDKETTKKSDIETSAKVVVHAFKNNFHHEYGVGIDAALTRIIDENKTYIDCEVFPSEDNFEFIGALAMIKEFFKFENNPFLGVSEENKEANSLVDEICNVIDYIAAFLVGKIDLNAQFGAYDGNYNLKAEYEFDKGEGNVEKNDFWYGADDDTLSSYFGVSPQSDFIINSYLMTSVFGGLGSNKNLYKEDLSDKKTYKGESQRDIIFDERKTAAFFAEEVIELLKIFGNNDAAEQVKCINKYKDSFISWITVENAEVKADFHNNTLPEKINTGISIKVNIPSEELRKMITDFSEHGIISKVTAILINFSIRNLGLCGLNGEKEYLGIELNANVEEKFAYGEDECDLSLKDGDLFLSLERENPDRVILKEVIEEAIFDVDVYLASLIESLPKDLPKEIIDTVKSGIEKALTEIDVADINKKTVNDIAVKILKDINTDNYGMIVKLAVEAAIRLLSQSEG